VTTSHPRPEAPPPYLAFEGTPSTPLHYPPGAAHPAGARGQVPAPVFAPAPSPVAPKSAGTHEPGVSSSVADAAPQQPRKGWQIIYDILATAELGAVVSWDALGRAVGKDTNSPHERNLVSVMVRRAMRELEQTHGLLARNVRGRGFRIAPQEERLEVARIHQDRAAKHVSLAQREVSAVNLGAMDPTTRRAFEATAMALSHQAQVIAQTNIRQSKLEAVMAAVVDKQTVQGEVVEELQDRLAKLEVRMGHAGIAPAHPAPPPANPYAVAGGQVPPHWQYSPGYSPGPVTFPPAHHQ
jgi:hypothetical protein